MFSITAEIKMEESNLDYQVWTISCYLLTTSLKCISSMKLHRDLGVTQNTT